MTPNVNEAKRAAGLDGHAHHDLSEVGGRLVETLGESALLITRGAQGTRSRSRSAAARRSRTPPRLANAGGGVAVGKVGTQTVTLDELREAAATF